jgi:phosphoribosylcarboxyaminoimidazole (NCAIR) mutase
VARGSATIAIDNATNAGILVTQMFGITVPETEEQVGRMREETRSAYNDIELDSEYLI